MEKLGEGRGGLAWLGNGTKSLPETSSCFKKPTRLLPGTLEWGRGDCGRIFLRNTVEPAQTLSHRRDAMGPCPLHRHQNHGGTDLLAIGHSLCSTHILLHGF